MSDCYANWSDEALLDSQHESLYARDALIKRKAVTGSLVDEAAKINADINKLQAQRDAIFQELTRRRESGR